MPPAGPSSPARPATPQSRGSPVPPPPPPRPSSRPKLPPGKPITDLVRRQTPSFTLEPLSFQRQDQTKLRSLSQSRPFSPPVSGSPPPFAPLARAESSSSLSSVTSHSAASTPTLGRDLSMPTAGTEAAARASPRLHVHTPSCLLSSCPCLTVLSVS